MTANQLVTAYVVIKSLPFGMRVFRMMWSGLWMMGPLLLLWWLALR